jgi:hypothetical protein
MKCESSRIDSLICNYKGRLAFHEAQKIQRVVLSYHRKSIINQQKDFKTKC